VSHGPNRPGRPTTSRTRWPSRDDRRDGQGGFRPSASSTASASTCWRSDDRRGRASLGPPRRRGRVLVPRVSGEWPVGSVARRRQRLGVVSRFDVIRIGPAGSAATRCSPSMSKRAPRLRGTTGISQRMTRRAVWCPRTPSASRDRGASGSSSITACRSRSDFRIASAGSLAGDSRCRRTIRTGRDLPRRELPAPRRRCRTSATRTGRCCFNRACP